MVHVGVELRLCQIGASYRSNSYIGRPLSMSISFNPLQTRTLTELYSRPLQQLEKVAEIIVLQYAPGASPAVLDTCFIVQLGALGLAVQVICFKHLKSSKLVHELQSFFSYVRLCGHASTRRDPSGCASREQRFDLLKSLYISKSSSSTGNSDLHHDEVGVRLVRGVIRVLCVCEPRCYQFARRDGTAQGSWYFLRYIDTAVVYCLSC